jgi:hypothetical protein
VRTIVLIDLANVGKTLLDKGLMFDAKETFQKIASKYEIAGAWAFSDMHRQFANRWGQVELYELNCQLVHVPKVKPTDKNDDAALIAQVEWLLDHYAKEFDAIHLLSGDGDYDEVMRRVYAEGKTVVIDSSNLLAISGLYDNYTIRESFLVASPLSREHNEDDDDVLKAVKLYFSEFENYLNIDPPKDIPFGIWSGSGYYVFEGETWIIDGILGSIMQLAQQKNDRNELCAFGYIVSVIGDRCRNLSSIGHAINMGDTDIDPERSHEWVRAVLSGALSTGLLEKRIIDVPGGERLTCVPNLELYNFHFCSSEEDISPV